LPVEFGAVGRLAPCPGAGTGIETWREVPDIWLSTSVEEGFGMMFAEARILGKPVIGRKLAHLEEIGVLNWGYDRLLVPVDWVGRDALNCWREQAWWALLQAHGHRAAAPPEPAQKCQSIMQKAGEEETHVDFGNLPELLQQRVLIHLQAFPEDAKQVLAEFQPQRSLEDSNEPQGQPLPLQEWLQFGLGHLGSPGTDPFRTGTDLFQPEARGWLTEDEFWHAIQGAEENHDAGMELLEQTPGGVGWLDARKVLEECLWGMDQGAADGTERNGKQQPFHFLLAPGLDEGGLPDFHDAEAVIFDVYGTLLQGKPGGVRQDNRVDVMLNALLARLGHRPVTGLTSLLEIEVRRRHLESGRQHPEIDLRDVWRTVLGWQHPLEELDAWVVETETIWHPVEPMPGAFDVVETLAQRGCVLGLLSNAQCNTRHELEPIFGCFHPGLTVFSYHYGTAKPGRELYQELVNRLHSMGIRPENAWMIGNDPLHDIIPAANMGFRTALFTGSGSSLRRGWAVPTCRFGVWECG
jgi:putative hydrolase of the HAD superfamily